MKRGFTLIELMVYMAIVGLVVVIAGEAFSNSTKFRVRTDNMIKATQEAENVATLFKEDAQQMGIKSLVTASSSSQSEVFYYMSSSAEVYYRGVDSLVYMDPKNSDENKRDSSSFRLKCENKDFCDLTFRRLSYNTDGVYRAVEEIRWYVEKEELKRSCSIVASDVPIPDKDPCHDSREPVVMATGVKKFDVEAARPSVKEKKAQIFPPNNQSEFRLINRAPEVGYASAKVANATGSTELGGDELVLSEFHTNYQSSDDEGVNGVLPKAMWNVNQLIAIKNETTLPGGNWNMLCDSYGKMTFYPDTLYEISFIVSGVDDDDKSLMFVPGEDHMSVGFRKAGSGEYAKFNNDTLLHDFMFFPPLDPSNGAGKRSMRFTVPRRVDNVCVAFTFAFFSPLASLGKVTIKDLRVSRVPTANYSFSPKPEQERFEPEVGNNVKEKKNVKALRLRLQVSRGAKRGGKGETGEVDLIVPIPSNGPRD